MKIDFTSKYFKFISKEDEYFIEGNIVECESDYTEWFDSKIISTGWGMFRGLTNVSYSGYQGELPRMDGDTSTFSEFDIYWKEHKIDELTYIELTLLIQSESRDEKIQNIFEHVRKINELNKIKSPPKKDIKPIEKKYPFQIGDVVTSTWNTYGKDDACELDRLYKRKDGGLMARIIWKNKKVNVPLDTLKYHKSHFRNDKLDQLGL